MTTSISGPWLATREWMTSLRHWALGIGSRDLIVTTGGSKPETFDLPNVLFVGGKLKQIEELLRSRSVVAGR